PPANKTLLFGSSVAACPCIGPANAVVGLQVATPSNSSAELSTTPAASVPPAARTCPFETIVGGNRVAVCPCRADVIVPAAVQVPVPLAGSKSNAVATGIPMLLPPAIRTFPLASTVAVWPSRAVASGVRVVHADVPSNTWTEVRLELIPKLPPTTKTLLLSVGLPGTFSRVAVWKRRATAMLATAVQVPVPDDGL